VTASEPAAQCSQAARHLLFDVTSPQLHRAIEQLSFERLRAQENAKSFGEWPEISDARTIWADGTCADLIPRGSGRTATAAARR
jgi:hypothetical protein